MEELRRRLVEDLSDTIEGELRVDPAAVAVFSSDASLYEIEPIAVVFPAHTRDVEVIAAYSADNNIPLIPRGAGSGLAGGAIGRGIVIDFSRHMNRVLWVDGNRVRVQPGVVREQLNRELRKHGRYFAPDPSNSRITTIGGMLGVDAAGSHAVRYGSTRDHVESIECVLSGGQRMELGREPLELDPSECETDYVVKCTWIPGSQTCVAVGCGRFVSIFDIARADKDNRAVPVISFALALDSSLRDSECRISAEMLPTV